MTPKVSGIMIFLNGERFIEEAISSVLKQGYQNWELLLVDDGSNDRSAEIAEKYVTENPDKIRYLQHPNHENRGMSASRNLGLSAARGEYIAFLDCDDVWVPNKLHDQTEILDAHPEVAMVYGRTLIWHSWTGKAEDRNRDSFCELGVSPGTVVNPPRLFELLIENRVQSPTTCNAMIRREILERVGGFEDRFRGMYEDQVLFAKIHLIASTYVAGECWAHYRQHSASKSNETVTTKEYYIGRKPFLTWLQNYLEAQRVSDGTVAWNAVQKEFRKSENSAAGPLATFRRRLGRGIGRMLKN